MSWIRWQGLLVFVGVVAGLAAGIAFIAGPLVKWSIEGAGSRAVGARVEVADARLSFSPVGLVLTDLQVANPDAPMTNAVQVDRIELGVEPLPLLRRKVIIPALKADGVQPNTPRSRSGALPGRKAAPDEKSSRTFADLKLPGIDLPSPKELLAREELTSVALAKQLQADVGQRQSAWRERLAALPDKEKLDDYRARLDRLKAVDKDPQALLTLSSDLQALKADLGGDLKGLREAKDGLKDDISTLRTRLAEVRAAPQKDVARLKEKYALSGEGLSNVSRALFGNRIAGWVDTAVRWYRRVAPYLERPAASRGKKEAAPRQKRAGGIDIRFPEHEPLPDFLIRTAQLSVVLPAGNVAGRIDDITPDQDVLGRPLTFDFASDALRGIKGLNLKGALNHVDPQQPRDTADLTVRGYRATGVELVKSDTLGLTLAEGAADIDLNAELRAGHLDAKGSAALDAVRFATTTESKGAIATSIASALDDVKRFRLDGEVSGTPTDYDLSLSSDLDRVLKDAFGKQVKAQAAEFETQLTAAINEQIAGPLGSVDGKLGELGLLEGDLQGRLKEGNSIRDEIEKRIKEAAAGKIEEKLGGGLKDRLKGKVPGF
ncbi:MAG: TIGR03545 family protein [Nitrospirota bacterium]|jgi:uncharacterized protein (TIGR03545 family)